MNIANSVNLCRAVLMLVVDRARSDLVHQLMDIESIEEKLCNKTERISMKVLKSRTDLQNGAEKDTEMESRELTLTAENDEERDDSIDEFHGWLPAHLVHDVKPHEAEV